MKRAVVIFLLFLLNYLTSAQAQFWERLDGPYGGAARALAVSPSNHLFAGMEGANGVDVYRSTNSGTTWSATNNYPTSFISSTSLAVNASGYIFSGDNNGGGMYRSTDDGASWMQINAGLTELRIQALTINNAGHVFVGAQYGGVFRSTDAGDNWTKVNNGLGQRNVRAIVTNSSGHIFAATTDSGMFRSTDSAQQWMPINAGIAGVWVNALAVDTHDRIFAGTYDGRIFRSTNNGQSWIEMTAGVSLSFVNALTVGNEDVVFAASQDAGVFRSTDNGDTWVQVNSGLPYLQTRSLAVDSTGQVYIGMDGGGIFRSTNAGDEWSYASNGLMPLGMGLIRVNSRDHLFAVGSSVPALFRSTDSGINWALVRGIPTEGALSSLAIVAGDQLILAQVGGTAYRSSDNGEHWTAIDAFDGLFIRSIASAPNGDALAITGCCEYNGLFRSTDGGVSWAEVHGVDNYVEAATVTKAGYIFVAACSLNAMTYTKIYRSTDNGGPWISREIGYRTNLRDFSVNSKGHLFALGTYGMLRSTDNGESWEWLSGVKSACEIVINRRDEMFASSGGEGIFHSTDNGITWNVIDSGIPVPKSACSLAFDSSGRILAAAPSGLYRSVKSTTSVGELAELVPHSCQLTQNYPNPFNPNTVIEYELPRSCQVTLTVYDLLGREIATLRDRIEEPGYKSVEWNASGVASGVYFYRLQAGDFVATKKLLLLR